MSTYTFTSAVKKGTELIDSSFRSKMIIERKKRFKRELLDVFRKYGYLDEGKDYEVTFRTTSGNIAWININSIEIIK
jgi:hypothetical protein